MSTPALTDKPWQQSYDHHVPQSFGAPSHALTTFLEQAARDYPEETALIFKGTRLRYREVNEMADAVAAGLHARGFKQGDRAVLLMPNIPQFVFCYYGILKAGGIVVALEPHATERELEAQLADCGAQTAFVMSQYYATLKAVQAAGQTRVQAIIVTYFKTYMPTQARLRFGLRQEKKAGHAVPLRDGDTAFADLVALRKRYPPPQLALTGDDIALIQYGKSTVASSTVASPSGAIGLHRNLVANVYQLRAWLPDTRMASHTILATMPFCHTYGMAAAMNLGMALAATLILIPDALALTEILSASAKYEPTIFLGEPAIYRAINNNPAVAKGKYDAGSIRYHFSGPTLLPPEEKQRFEVLTGRTIIEGYGLRECHAVTHITPILGLAQTASIGLPLPGIACKIVDVDDATQELGVGEIGALALRGPNVMPSYWEKPEATAAVFHNGWLLTGTLAEMDEQGYFYLHDRESCQQILRAD